MFGRNYAAPEQTRKIIVILTDGGSNNFDRTVEEAVACKVSRISIVAVAIGKWVNDNEIHAMASPPVEETVLKVEDFDQLTSKCSVVQNLVCGGRVVVVMVTMTDYNDDSTNR